MGFMPDINEVEPDDHFDGRTSTDLQDEYTNEDGYVEDEYDADMDSMDLSLNTMLGH